LAVCGGDEWEVLKEEVTFFEKKVTKKTFAGGLAAPVSLYRPRRGR
jgi:hypothetical protein